MHYTPPKKYSTDYYLLLLLLLLLNTWALDRMWLFFPSSRDDLNAELYQHYKIMLGMGATVSIK